MACESTSPLSYLGAMSTGAMIDGTGYAPVGSQELINNIKGVAGDLLVNAQQAINASSAYSNISNIGSRSFHGHGAFSNTVPEDLDSRTGAGVGLDKISAHTNLMFGSNPIQMAQTMTIASSFVNTSAQLAPTLEQLKNGVYFGGQPGLDNFEYPADGVFPNYLGKGYKNYTDVLTNGLSSLFNTASTDNFDLLAEDLLALGKAFNLENANDFMNPGQVIQSIEALGGLTATGIQDKFVQLGIDFTQIYNLGATNYNAISLSVLASITTPKLIADAQRLLGSNVANMESLADFLNFEKIFVRSKDVINFTTIQEFKESITAIETGRIQTIAQLGAYISSTVVDNVGTINNATQFTNPNYVQTMISKFLGGTGANGRVTIIDMLGLLGGQGLGTASKDYKDAMNELHTAGELTALNSRFSTLTSGLGGAYTTITTPGNGFIYDNTGPTPIAIGSASSPVDLEDEGYPSYVNAKRGQIESELSALYAKRNVNDNIDKAIAAWRTFYSKVDKEKDFQSRIDMNYDNRTNYPDVAYSFTSNLRFSIDEPGKSALIIGMVEQAQANGDVGGDFVRAYISELQNRKAGDTYDVRWRAELCE